MLIQLLADITRDKKVIGELIESPEKTLKRYPGITKKQAQLVMTRDLKAIAEAAAAEVSDHFAMSRFSVLYFGLDIKFDSITPDSHCANDKVSLIMVLKLNQSPVDPGKLSSSVVFARRSDNVKAKVASTVYDRKNSTITIRMTAKFPTKGAYNSMVKIWAAGKPKENTSLTTGNIFTAS